MEHFFAAIQHALTKKTAACANPLTRNMNMERVLKRPRAIMNDGGMEVSVDTLSCPEWYTTLAEHTGLVTGGDAFDSFQQCRSRVLRLALAAGFQVLVRGCSNHRTWWCKVHEDCPFKICASMRKHGQVGNFIHLLFPSVQT